jgi:hypothetical protein
MRESMLDSQERLTVAATEVGNPGKELGMNE